jgi:hypothetical protein
MTLRNLRHIYSLWILSTLFNLISFQEVVAQENSNSICFSNFSNVNSLNRESRKFLPERYYTVQFDLIQLRNVLQRAPLEFTTDIINSPSQIKIPLPNGQTEDFRMVKTQLMEPGLANRYPHFVTYAGISLENPTHTIYISITELGLHAMIVSPEGNVFIDPVELRNTKDYIIYFRKDLIAHGDFICETDTIKSANWKNVSSNTNTQNVFRSNGTQLRTYRLALACTGEYAATKGGTTSGALAGMVASMTRVNGVYESEVAIRMVLIANNTSIIYLNSATDPYTNNNGVTMLGENQLNIDAVIGTANYDIGHVFSTGGGGVASLNSPCSASSKARGVTGLGNPTGDAFDIDYVAHEMGHQFGGNHTFNSATSSCNGNRSANAAYEPGSGITIMAYAGICGADNLAANSIAYFHCHSINEILNFSVNGNGNLCAAKTTTGNTAPLVTLPALTYTIPFRTPFTLTGSATDANSDAWTYSWEELDRGAAGAWNAPAGDAPIFRPFSPTISPSRTFPKIADIVNNVTVIGELLPTYARNLKFRLTVRDNRVGGGGVTYPDDTLKIQVINTTTPFQVTVPNTAVSWNVGSTQTVTWAVSSTNVSPINCTNVRISLSTDGGYTYPTVLKASTPNDGSESITIPANPSTTARIKVEAVGNIFFDISNTNFSIIAVPVTLNLKAFIQGFYLGSGLMTQIVDVGKTDTITVELHNTTAPFATVFTDKKVLSTAGLGMFNFPAAANGNSYYIVVRHRNSIQTWSKTPVYFATITNFDFTTNYIERPYLFIIHGESNAGGYALNTDANATELAPRSSIKILNNNSLIWEPLDIGTNNALAHFNSPLNSANNHSVELELGNISAQNSKFANSFIVKVSHGGSTMQQWEVGNSTGYFTSYVNRLTTAKNLLNGAGTSVKPVIIISLGLNDTPFAWTNTQFKTKMKDLIANLRGQLSQYGNVPVVFTNFQSFPTPPNSLYNTAIDGLATEVSNCYIIDSNGALIRDSNHWSYLGFKTLVSRFVDIINLNNL